MQVRVVGELSSLRDVASGVSQEPVLGSFYF